MAFKEPPTLGEFARTAGVQDAVNEIVNRHNAKAKDAVKAQPPDLTPEPENPPRKRLKSGYIVQETDRQRIERQIENLLVAKAMMDEVPDHNISWGLRSWADMSRGGCPSEDQLAEFHCGSSACFGGWCAIHPHFEAQGVRRCWDGSPDFRDAIASDIGVSEYLFGSYGAFHSGGNGNEREEIDRRINGALEGRVRELEALG